MSCKMLQIMRCQVMLNGVMHHVPYHIRSYEHHVSYASTYCMVPLSIPYLLAGCLEQLLVDLVELVAAEVPHVLEQGAVPSV